MTIEPLACARILLSGSGQRHLPGLPIDIELNYLDVLKQKEISLWRRLMYPQRFMYL